ncbi:MAG: hypothetical protein A3K66_07875 [Euryarchaeota archaeon RBG_16_67_27]|nr:MAG: hypothetical protein A3K66_07875 [Euryarchaeota archaeon RBG_16_67_27]
MIAVITFVAGFGVGSYLFPQTPAPGPEKEVLLLGTNTPFPPFESRNTTSGNLEGFDIDLIQTMVTRAGYAYEWRDFRDFTALLAATAAEGVDIAIGAITMNGATGTLRNQTLDFTDPYYEADQGVLKLTADATDYCPTANDCTATDLNDAAYTVAVQDITTSLYWAEAELPDVTLVVLPSVSQVLQALSAGNVDFVVIDHPAAVGIAGANPAFTVEGTIQTDELYGFAVPNNDPKNIVEKLNTALAAIRTDGTYDTLVAKWF